jgi:hypothetical protein
MFGCDLQLCYATSDKANFMPTDSRPPWTFLMESYKRNTEGHLKRYFATNFWF